MKDPFFKPSKVATVRPNDSYNSRERLSAAPDGGQSLVDSQLTRLSRLQARHEDSAASRFTGPMPVTIYRTAGWSVDALSQVVLFLPVHTAQSRVHPSPDSTRARPIPITPSWPA